MLPLSIVIPTYKATDHLLCCVRSLLRSSDKSFEVCIYGDGGGDESRVGIDQACELLRAQGIAVQAQYNPTNLGNTPAVNAGARMATREWLLFVNDDMVIPSNGIQKYCKLVRPGCVLSLTCFEPNEFGHRPAACFIPLNLGLDPTHFDFERLDRESAAHSSDAMEIGVNYPFIVEKKLFDVCGGADETFLGPYHDPDLFLRFKLSGAEFLRTRVAPLYHFSGVSIRFGTKISRDRKKKRKSKYWNKLEIRARLDFIKKWGAKPKAKFGEVPRTRALRVWSLESKNATNVTRFALLFCWEWMRAQWLLLRNRFGSF